MLKDLRLSQEAAQLAGVNTALGRLAAQIYGQFEAAGGGGAGFSAIIQAIWENGSEAAAA